VDARTAARMLALGRIAAGLGLLVAPPLVSGAWTGRHAGNAHAKVLGRALGARDLVIGLGALAALGGRGAATPWLLAGLVADTTDFVVTVAERDDLPGIAVPVIGSAAGAGIVLGLYGLTAGEQRTPVPA
jgi:hypothetical protein